MEFRLKVPGSTSNLGPGFDTLGLALALHNSLSIHTTSEPGLALSITGIGEESLPRDESNLFYRSAAAAADRAGKPLPGLVVGMENRIPLARGLGSSSTAIVAGIVAAHTLCGESFSRSEMLDLAAELEGHPDNVSACLYGGLTICSLADGHVTCIRSLPPEGLRVVVAVPRFEVETEAARKALPAQVSHLDATYNVNHACLVTAALLSGDLEALKVGMSDRLHQPYRAPMVQGFDQVLAAALSSGALGACLSGAGPTMLAFAEGDTDQVEAAMVQAWEDAGIQSDAQSLEIDAQGVTVE
ncbi:MAG: homoserine kinase [Candidatus Latescibacteria bacterium]|jgi:homoserine kinase|nr:homoserine kinase [Candidatus Latescibacterota bacterium]